MPRQGVYLPYRKSKDVKFEFSPELARLTKLRTLADMSEREIRALEQFYGCPVLRPAKRTRKSPVAVASAAPL